MAGPGLSVRRRLVVMLSIFAFLIFVLAGRVAWIQFVSSDWLQKKAFEQHVKSRTIPPKRGSILDRNGNELAVSASVEMIAISPADIKDSVGSNPQKLALKIDMIASFLADTLKLDKEKIVKKLTTNSRYEVLARKVEKDISDKIRKWRQENKIDGIYIDEDSKRYYPNNNLAAHVIGFTGIDNQGLDGIEMTMEKYLKGVPGRIMGEVDAGGRDLPTSEEKRFEAQNGLDVVLTIDETIQHLAEKALDRAISDNKVINGAIALVMDPRNGEILAMVSKPDFNLNNPKGVPPGIDPKTWKGETSEEIKKLSETVWRNKAMKDTYEPGSTFKAITSAAGLEENVIKPESRVNDKTINVGGWNIDCWKPNFHGDESFIEAVYNSCNPVFVKVAQSLGVERFYRYVRAFGFYDRTGVELSGEAGSIIHSKPSEVDMASAAFGQRFQISPLQLITAYGAIANGGKLMKPHLLKEVRDQEGSVVKKTEPEVVRTVISKKTSDTLKDILEGVVSTGTGKNAYAKGYRVAGKTGTSETLDKNRYIASFSAFAPADNPVICVLVALDNPQVYPHTGGMIAAPVAGRLVEDILNYLEVDRRYTEMDKEMMLEEVSVPNLKDRSLEDAKKLLKSLGLDYKIENKGNTNSTIVKEQTPKSNAVVPQKSVVILYTYEPDKPAMIKIPDLMNKTIPEATRVLNDVGLNIKVDGIGTAIDQKKKPGDHIQKGEVVEVVFRHLNTE